MPNDRILLEKFENFTRYLEIFENILFLGTQARI